MIVIPLACSVALALAIGAVIFAIEYLAGREVS
ncbi:hypothetical protein DFP91_1570 [Pseudorhodoplanes sinuspersici]|nr:hypothetical protein DFP91_1570 [Pseudorhodoplanes sinuspersici]